MDNVRLPEDVEAGAQGGPGFLTTVISTSGGHEQRNQEWSAARLSWDIAYGIRTKADFSAVLAFFYARRGRLRSFLFKDWSDFESDGEQTIGVGDATNSVVDFQLIKTYADDVNAYVRNIIAPVDGTIVVKVDGVVKTEGVDWTLNSLGIIHFAAAPADGTVITASYEFDVPVRFDIDKMSLALEWYNAGSIPSLPIIEVFPTDV